MSRSDSVELLMPLLALAVALLVRGAAWVGRRLSVLDIPNDRSSHKLPVPRLGGAAFVPAMFLSLLYAWPYVIPSKPFLAPFFGGAAILYIIALVDDIVSLRASIRLLAQLLSALIIINGIAPCLPFPISWIGGGLGVLWIVGVVNIYNFMDGIDGIAGLQGFVAGIGWLVLGVGLGAPVTMLLGACAAGASVGFLTLNWPPARIFMGDAGSTVLGYCFAVAPLLATCESGSGLQTSKMIVAAVLMIWPFLGDGIFTLMRRIKNKENIFTAHRSHLYQRLVVAGNSHRSVTLVYGGMAAIGSALAYCVNQRICGNMNLPLGIVSICFMVLWFWTTWSERMSLSRSM
jgi:UDP-N-acetylmuramyl pentapeptide phosphotransferase/UDP-N-acetylglucosamine-1-phosphate transferase